MRVYDANYVNASQLLLSLFAFVLLLLLLLLSIFLLLFASSRRQQQQLEMNALVKSTNTICVVMSLLLFTTALLIGAVANESVNKSIAPSVAPPPAHIDHADLPTKFGDEDDVIEGKAAAEKKASETAAAAAASSAGKKQEHHYGFESNEDQYDDDDDFLGEHYAGKNAHHDVEESDSEYDEESDLGPTLDNFGAKLDGTDAGNELPIFLVEPQSGYIVRNRAVTLKCKAAHALQVRNADSSFFLIKLKN